MPIISVVIPVCNVERYLPQCLDSVIGQSFQNIEIICIDDGSSDNSGIILDEYAKRDCRIHVIHKENTGYGSSMNIGLSYAAGDYIAIVESDDFAEPDMLEKLYSAAIQSGAEITKANHYNYKGGIDFFCDWVKDFPKNQLINVLEYPSLLYISNTVWTCLYQKHFLLKHAIAFHETPGAAYQDISFAIQGWLCARKVFLINDAVLHYRNDNPNSSVNNPYKIFCVFDEYQWLERKFKELWHTNLEVSEIERYFVATKYKDYLGHYYRVAVQYKYAFLYRMWESIEADRQKGRVQEAAFDENIWKSVDMIAPPGSP